jgi:hypothetical protein
MSPPVSPYRKCREKGQRRTGQLEVIWQSMTVMPDLSMHMVQNKKIMKLAIGFGLEIKEFGIASF